MKAISILRMLIVCLAGITLSACTDWMYDDRSGCEHGVCLSFKYDYNLQAYLFTMKKDALSLPISSQISAARSPACTSICPKETTSS